VHGFEKQYQGGSGGGDQPSKNSSNKCGSYGVNTPKKLLERHIEANLGNFCR
jgi:hypothetical protein